MAFTYDASSPGNRDKLRLQIGDTSSTSYTFEDAELDIFLTLTSNDIYLAAARACRALAVNNAKKAIWYRTQGFWMDRRDVAKVLLKMAQDFEAAAKATVFEYESTLEDFVDTAGKDLSSYVDTESSS